MRRVSPAWIVVVFLVAIGCRTAPSPNAAAKPPADDGSSQVASAGQSPAPGPEPQPVPAAALGDVAEVEVASPIYSHAGCIRRGDGTVWCWAGPNILLHFGRGRAEPLPGPWQVEGLADAAALFATTDGHCAVRDNGKGVCWSGKTSRELEIDDLRSIAGGSGYLCALRRDGTVWCSGKNYNGDIGRPPRRRGVPGGVSESGWQAVPGATGIRRLAGRCGIRGDGELFCWGPHALRPVHDGSDVEQFLASVAPRRVRGLPAAVRAAVGDELGCLVTRAGGVECYERREPDAPPVHRSLDVAHAIDVRFGLGGVVILAADGDVYYWGPGPTPHVVDGAEWARRKAEAFGTNRPRPVPGMRGATQISATGSHVCAVTVRHHLLCWGVNDVGQLQNSTLARASRATYAVRFTPGLMAGPGEGVFGCKPSAPIQKTCHDLAATKAGCALEPPPGYWTWGPGGGALCDEACMDRAMNEVRKRAVPACMCTCTPEYQKLRARHEAKRPRSPPP